MFFFRPNRYYNQQYWPPTRPMHYPPFHEYHPYSMPPPPNEQGLMKNLNIESILNKIQTILSVAEQITPLIEQYGPLIKSAPALLQLLKDTSDDEDDDDNENEQSTVDETDEEDRDVNENKHSKRPKKKKRRSETIKESVPKLYI